MKRLLGVRQYKYAAAEGGHASDTWRKVPKVNIIPGTAKGLTFPWFLRVILVLVILWEAYLIQAWYTSKVNAEKSTEIANAELRTAQNSLSTGQNQVDDLQTQITAAQQALTQAERANNALKSQLVDWSAGLSQLFGISTQGVTLKSVVGKPGGQLTLVAIASNAKAVADFQVRLHEASQVLKVETIRWEGSDGSYTLTATLTVKN